MDGDHALDAGPRAALPIVPGPRRRSRLSEWAEGRRWGRSEIGGRRRRRHRASSGRHRGAGRRRRWGTALPAGGGGGDRTAAGCGRRFPGGRRRRRRRSRRGAPVAPLDAGDLVALGVHALLIADVVAALHHDCRTTWRRWRPRPIPAGVRRRRQPPRQGRGCPQPRRARRPRPRRPPSPPRRPRRRCPTEASPVTSRLLLRPLPARRVVVLELLPRSCRCREAPSRSARRARWRKRRESGTRISQPSQRFASARAPRSRALAHSVGGLVWGTTCSHPSGHSFT